MLYERECVIACVLLCERERESERASERGRGSVSKREKEREVRERKRKRECVHTRGQSAYAASDCLCGHMWEGGGGS